VADQRVGLDEGTGIQQELQPFPGGELATGVLALDRVGAAPQRGRRLQLTELLDPLLAGRATVGAAQVALLGRDRGVLGEGERVVVAVGDRFGRGFRLALLFRVRHGAASLSSAGAGTAMGGTRTALPIGMS